jgi:hypothetical protein
MDKAKLIKSTAWTTWTLLLIAIAVLFGMILKYPFRETSDIEFLLSQAPIPLAVILCNIYLFTAFFNRTKANMFRCAMLVIAFGVVCMASSRRGDQVRQLNWKFDGSVVRKFKPNNHGARTLEIKGLGGGNYEFVDDAFWEVAQPGDRIVKDQYSAYAELNGEKKVFIQNQLIGTSKGQR